MTVVFIHAYIYSTPWNRKVETYDTLFVCFVIIVRWSIALKNKPINVTFIGALATSSTSTIITNCIFIGDSGLPSDIVVIIITIKYIYWYAYYAAAIRRR